MTLRRKVLVAATALGFAFAGAVVAGVSSNDTDRPATPTFTPTGSSGGSYSESQLHQDYNMTRYMGNPDAAGPMFSGQLVDPQLQHSQSPAFVRELEEHQADMDRMLGKGQP